MTEFKLGEIEAQFADIIWKNEPISSGELVKLCEKELNWKKSTTYTVLRRVCERGIFKNQDGVVSSKLSKQEFLSGRSEKFVDDIFHGSLPGFLAAFTRRKKLSEKEIEEIQKIIQENREGER